MWSFNKLVELNPSQKFYYQHVTKAEVTGEREITFTFDQKGNRELPNIVGQLLVLPKHWWEGKDASGRQRNIGNSTLEPPMGSGPYHVERIAAGKTIVYRRNDDYWAKDLPIGIGQNNFDEIRYEVFLDDTVEFEGFKARRLRLARRELGESAGRRSTISRPRRRAMSSRKSLRTPIATMV